MSEPRLPSIPTAVVALQAVYGSPSQAGFGSAVFYNRIEQAENLEQAALKHYRYFLGDLWDRFGAAAWMTPWQQVYRRNANRKPDVVAELRSLTGDAASSVTMLLDAIDNPDAAQKALSDAYDNEAMSDLVTYTVGDGAAISGILIAGQRKTGEATFLVFLLD